MYVSAFAMDDSIDRGVCLFLRNEITVVRRAFNSLSSTMRGSSLCLLDPPLAGIMHIAINGVCKGRDMCAQLKKNIIHLLRN